MKKILFLLMFLASLQVKAQKYPAPLIDGKVYYSQVINVDSTSKEDLYRRAKLWISSAFNSSKAVIDLDDKDNQQVVGKANMQWSSVFVIAMQNNFCEFSFSIKSKNNKVKIEFYDFQYGTTNSQFPKLEYKPIENIIEKLYTTKNYTEKQFTHIDIEIAQLLDSFNVSISKKPKSDDF